MPLPNRVLPLGLALAAALAMGWWLSISLTPDTAARGSRAVVDQQVASLLSKLDQKGDLPQQDRQRLLMRLLELGRLEEAQLVLEPLLREQPRSISLALLMADLRRLNNDPDQARRDLDLLLRLHPNHPRVLELRVLVEQQQKRGPQALEDIKTRFEAGLLHSRERHCVVLPKRCQMGINLSGCCLSSDVQLQRPARQGSVSMRTG